MRSLVTEYQGHRVELLPMPIRSAPVLAGIQWGRLGTPEQAVAKEELIRMLNIYERFGAVQQPIKIVEGKGGKRTIWSVKFPSGSRWASGPERASAFQAILDNYAKNGFFKGYNIALDHIPTLGNVRNIDKIVDRALAKDNAQAKEMLQ